MKRALQPSNMVKSWLVRATAVINASHFSLTGLREPIRKYLPKFAGERRGEAAHTGLSDYSLTPLPPPLPNYLINCALVNSTGAVHILN